MATDQSVMDLPTAGAGQGQRNMPFLNLSGGGQGARGVPAVDQATSAGPIPPSALPKALSTGMGSPISAAPKIASQDPIALQQVKVDTATADAQKAAADLAYGQQNEKAVTEREKSNIQQKFADEERARIEQAKKDIGQAHAFAPTKENGQSLLALFGLMNVMAGMSGGTGKYAAMNAMANMNGAMKGYNEGKKSLFDQEIKEYDKNMQTFKANQESVLKLLQEAQHLASVDKDASMQKLLAARAEAGNGLVGMQLRQGNTAAALKTQETILDGLKKHKEEYAKMDYQHKLSEQSRRAAEAAAMAKAEKEHAFRLEEERIKLSEKLKNQNGDKVSLPMIQGVRSIENLQKQLRDPDVQQGLKAKAAPLIEKILSLGDKTDFEQAVNSTLTGTDKTTVFLKDALLASYEIERAAAGGQRLTVQMMKTVGPVLDPTNYSAETYNEILEGRRKMLFNNLQDIGFTPERIKELSKQHPYEP